MSPGEGVVRDDGGRGGRSRVERDDLRFRETGELRDDRREIREALCSESLGREGPGAFAFEKVERWFVGVPRSASCIEGVRIDAGVA